MISKRGNIERGLVWRGAGFRWQAKRKNALLAGDEVRPGGDASPITVYNRV